VNQLVRFLLVGVFNTVWGYALIFGFMYLFSLSPEVSNVLGYAIGLISSYLLNRFYTFRSKNSKRGEFARFLGVFAAAFGANYATLHVLLAKGTNPYISQVTAGVVYVAASYLLSKAFVFKHRRASTR
jgi:putative flippase GtrA